MASKFSRMWPNGWNKHTIDEFSDKKASPMMPWALHIFGDTARKRKTRKKQIQRVILASLVTFVVTICFKALTSQCFVITILHLLFVILFVILFVTFFVILFVTFFVALFVTFRVALFVAFRVALFVIHLLPLRQHPHPKDLRDLFMKGSSFVPFSFSFFLF